ncbi:MAG: four helix bundle protein [Cyclobacteriaceae bacterium]
MTGLLSGLRLNEIEIRERLRRFAIEIFALSEKFPKTTQVNFINYQLTKSGTSRYANYRAAMRARSRAEFFSKLSTGLPIK